MTSAVSEQGLLLAVVAAMVELRSG